MADGGSVSGWLALLRDGEPAAAQKLWERYYGPLVEVARRRLAGGPRGVADEEDLALTAFESFCRRAAEGQFPDLTDRDGLWRLLVVITLRKLSHHRRDQNRAKRQAAVLPLDPDSGFAGLNAEALADAGPPPDLAAELAEQVQALLRRLDDPELRSVALWKMEGFTNRDIAAKLACAPRTVERKVRLIRLLWGREDRA